MISISISLCGWLTPLNYDLYLYQFVCMAPLNYDLYLYQFVCMADSFKLWSLSLSAGMTPLNYDLYIYQFVCMADSFKLWSLSLSVCVYGWLL